MKTFTALLIAALFTTAACKKDKDAAKSEPAKTEPAAKAGEPAKTEPATPEPVKTEPAKTEPAPAGQVTADSAGAHALALSEKLGKAASDAGTDCNKLGTSLKNLTEDAKQAAKNDRELEKTPEQKKEFIEKYEKQSVEKMGDVMKKAETCMSNPDVKAFIEALSAE